MKREQLEDEAKKTICVCYYYELCDTIGEMSDVELQAIIDNKYMCHELDDESQENCPEWLQARAEAIGEYQFEEGRGN